MSRRGQRFRALWQEFRITRLMSVGGVEANQAVWGRVPRRFVEVELGYGAFEGPSLEQTERTLIPDNRRRRKAAAQEEAALKKYVVSLGLEADPDAARRKAHAARRAMAKSAPGKQGMSFVLAEVERAGRNALRRAKNARRAA